ncbi:MAG: hypothetical protein M1820_005344 [Bogoriella megaspora]|nr:MAG: hypothetical protein M1820_005344 [Bogoriella megaspora]
MAVHSGYVPPHLRGRRQAEPPPNADASAATKQDPTTPATPPHQTSSSNVEVEATADKTQSPTANDRATPLVRTPSGWWVPASEAASTHSAMPQLRASDPRQSTPSKLSKLQPSPSRLEQDIELVTGASNGVSIAHPENGTNPATPDDIDRGATPPTAVATASESPGAECLKFEQPNHQSKDKSSPPTTKDLASKRGTYSTVATRGSQAPVETQKSIRSSRNDANQKKSGWIKNKDIPKAQPPSPDSNAWGSVNSGEECDFNSVEADGGWGALPGKRRRNVEYNLQDWDGSMAPPPVDWEARGTYKDVDMGARIREWCQISSNVDEESPVIDIQAEGFLTKPTGDIAPRIWVPETVDSASPQVFWNHHLKSDLYDGDPDAKPWWEMYRSPLGEILLAWAVPNITGFEDETPRETKRRLEDHGSGPKILQCISKIERNEEEQRESKRVAKYIDKERRRKERQAVPHPFYLRPAVAADIPGICKIYNKHIQHTVNCEDSEPISEATMKKRWEDICNKMLLPFIVAVERSMGSVRRRSKPPPATGSDKIIGFASAEDYNNRHGPYRYTVQLEIYVDPIHFKKKVGDALLDRMRAILIPTFCFSSGTYEFFAEGPPYDGGASRVIGNILTKVAYETENPNSLEGISRWLQKYEFKQVGNLEGIAIKLKRFVSVAIFQYKSGETIDPKIV